jgi:serine/threonine protein kinase
MGTSYSAAADTTGTASAAHTHDVGLLQKCGVYLEISSRTLIKKGGQAGMYFGLRHGQPCAVKVYKSGGDERREVAAVMHLQNGHPGLCFCRGVHVTATATVIVYDLALCDMGRVLSKLPRGMGECCTLKEWMRLLALTLGHMHTHHTAHGDVKPSNVLLLPQTVADTAALKGAARATMASAQGPLPSRAMLQHKRAAGVVDCDFVQHMAPAHRKRVAACLDTMLGDLPSPLEEGVIQLCDFGLSRVSVCGGTPSGYSVAGTLGYIAPEVHRRVLLQDNLDEFVEMWGEERADTLSHESYDATRVDVWAYGITLFVMSCGRSPFARACPTDARFRGFLRVQAKYDSKVLGLEVAAHDAPCWQDNDPPWTWPVGMSKEMQHLIHMCLRIDPVQRYSFAQVQRHVWLAECTRAWSPRTTMAVPRTDARGES